MKKTIALFLAAVLLCGICLLGGCSGGADTVYIAVEGYGLITVELNEKEAPITVRNFRV